MNNLSIVYPSEPFSPNKVDSEFAYEFDIAQQLGISTAFVDLEELESNPVSSKLFKIKQTLATNVIYRGWMLTVENYVHLFDRLNALGCRLINNPNEYQSCHHLPLSYPNLKQWSADTYWVNQENLNKETVKNALNHFGNKPVIIKDWVKSQAAGYWDQACFISDASDFANAWKVIQTFVDLQANSLVGGIVFREYYSLSRTSDNSAQVKEFRTFALDQKPICTIPRFESEIYQFPPTNLIEQVCVRLPGNFASVDFAQKEDKTWMLIEIGDGQVSGLPNKQSALNFYQSILKSLEYKTDLEKQNLYKF